MKKLFTAIITVCIVTACINTTNAQFIAGGIRKVPNDNFNPAASPFTSVSTKAMRDFTKNYPAVSAVKWYKTNEGQMAYFFEKGIKSRISYDNHGNCLYSMRSYNADALPKEIKSRVRSNYYDYTITIVNEITQHGNTFYLVRMENATQCQTVRVSDGEDMEVREAFIK